MLAKRRGDIERGKTVLAASANNDAACLKCHTVNGVGGKIGPDLSAIGTKASRENLLESILYPSKAIADQFVQWNVVTKKGISLGGLIVEEVRRVDRGARCQRPGHPGGQAGIESREKSANSLMPDDNAKTLTEEELLDLVEYLMTLQSTVSPPTVRSAFSRQNAPYGRGETVNRGSLQGVNPDRTHVQDGASLNPISDEDLFGRACLGDEAAFTALVKRYERELYGYLRRYLGDASFADDVFQNTFLQIYVKRDSYEPGRPVRPWLYAIATNQAIDFMRRRGRRSAVSLEHQTGEDAEGEVPSPTRFAGKPRGVRLRERLTRRDSTAGPPSRRSIAGVLASGGPARLFPGTTVPGRGRGPRDPRGDGEVSAQHSDSPLARGMDRLPERVGEVTMDENLIGYLLNALEPDERRQVEEYLRDHPEGAAKARTVAVGARALGI